VLLQIEADILHLIKLFPVCSIGPLHTALEFRRTGGNHKQSDLLPLTGLLEVAFELRASVDLDGPDPEGELSFQVVQE